MWNIFKKPNYLLLGATSLAFGSIGHATDILPSSSSTNGDVVITSATPQPYESEDTFTIHFYAKCYGTNLRGVTNPLSRNGIIEAKVDLDGEIETFDIPANQITNQARLFTRVMNLQRWVAIDEAGNIKKYKSASLADADEIKPNDPLPDATFTYKQKTPVTREATTEPIANLLLTAPTEKTKSDL
ncbi:hypothetical protein GW916_14385 [bacterium]|nr:hypothetical protein [bacterium]